MSNKVTILDGDEDAAGLDDEIEPEYELAGMPIDTERTLRFRARARARLIALDPDLLEFFKTPEAVNQVLRRVMHEMQGGTN